MIATYFSTALDPLPAEARPGQSSDPPAHVRFDARQPWHGTTPAEPTRTEPKSNVDKPP